MTATTIRRGMPVLVLPDGDYLKRGRADVAAVTPFNVDGVPTTRLLSNWRHVPLAHLRPHWLAAEVAALTEPSVDGLYFPSPPCGRCYVDTEHDGDGFVCGYCRARWDSNGIEGTYPCVECVSNEATVLGADEQPRCTLCEVQVRTGELEPTGPYECRGCKQPVYGIGPDFNSPAARNRRCGQCQQAVEHRAYIDSIITRRGAA